NSTASTRRRCMASRLTPSPSSCAMAPPVSLVPLLGCERGRILASRVVMGHVCRHRLFVQAFHGGRDRCGIFGISLFISSAYVLYRVCKTPGATMSLAAMTRSRDPCPAPLPLQPQRGSATAVVKGEVGGIVLDIGLPAARDHDGIRVHIVLLLGFIPLKGTHDLLPRLQVSGPPLFLEHGRDRGVVDMPPVERMVGD